MAKPVVRFEREEFLTERWQYRAGEHVTMIAPTQYGKTTLAFQLMGEAATPKVPAVTVVMKPRDRTVTKWQKQLNHKIIRHWPPIKTPWQQNITGYMLWPRHTFDPDKDDYTLYTEFRRCILDCYKKGNRILYGDEIYGLAQELGLTRELVAIWTRGASMGCGLWVSTQRPAYIPLWGYNQCEHLFLGKDPEDRSIKRFAEFGGIDPKIIYREVPRLNKYEYLYIRRSGPAVCVVGA